MTGGSPPTARYARTGLETPPGISSCARPKSCFERSLLRSAMRPTEGRRRRHQKRQQLAQGAYAVVRSRHSARPAQAVSVDPHRSHTGGRRPENVRHGVIADVEDLIRRKAQDAGEVQEYGAVRLD